MKTLMISFVMLLFFTGCGEKSISEQKKECTEQGKGYTVKKAFNHRTGKDELKVECR